MKNDIRINHFLCRKLSDAQQIYFKTDKFFYFGYEVNNFNQQDSSENQPHFSVSSVGVMVFKEGIFYLGYFNEDFKFEGEGIFFFAVGAFLRGLFVNGKV